mgnify:CR=1 FL=1
MSRPISVDRLKNRIDKNEKDIAGDGIKWKIRESYRYEERKSII